MFFREHIQQPLPLFKELAAVFVETPWRFLRFCFLCCGVSLILIPVNVAAVEETYLLDIQRLAADGDSEAQLALALFYEYGEEGIERNPEKSLFWLEKASDSCLACACLYLGIKFEAGNGVEQNFKKASQYYTCAARQDWPAAQFFLGRLYSIGKGVEKNLFQALAWVGLAVENGYPGADEEYGKLLNAVEGVNKSKLQEMQTSLLQKKAFCN